MISKRLFRGPWLWIVIIAAIVIGVLLTSGSDGSREIRTATMVTYLDDNKIKDVTFVEGDQEIKATLKDGKKVRAKWLGDQGARLVEQAEKKVADGQLKTFDVEVPKQSALMTILINFLPLVLIFVLLLFFLNSMQGGGGRIM
jgi:cell division protease FtsH